MPGLSGCIEAEIKGEIPRIMTRIQDYFLIVQFFITIFSLSYNIYSTSQHRGEELKVSMSYLCICLPYSPSCFPVCRVLFEKRALYTEKWVLLSSTRLSLYQLITTRYLTLHHSLYLFIIASASIRRSLPSLPYV